MKKSKILSLFTSLAVAGAAALNMLSFSASALENPVGLAMTADKTEFSIEDVKSGKATTQVYVDVTTEFDESDQVAILEFELWPEEWGTVDPMNLYFCDPNQLATAKGNKMSSFNSMSGTISAWDKETPKVSYMCLNFASEIENFEYQDIYPPKVILMSTSSQGYIRTGSENAGEHVAQFDVTLPEDLPEGEYTINFKKAKASIGEFGKTDSYNITDAKGITFTVSKDGGEDDDFLLGDANLDKKVNVRDCACIANALAKGTVADLPQKNSDYNQDGTINVRDAAALAKDIATGKIVK